MAPEKDDMDFSQLPQFAKFILDNYSDEYVAKEVSISRSMNIPLWQQFESISDDDIIQKSRPFYLGFLEAIAEKRIRQNLDLSIQQYKQDLLMHVVREQITFEDLLMTHAARKKTMLSFLPSYTSDTALFHTINEELDALFLKFNVISGEAYTDLLNQKMAEEKSIKDKLFSTSPGFYYLYDIASDSQILPSEKLFTVLGYSRYDFAGNPRFFRQIMHPEDLPGADSYLLSFEAMKEGDVKSFSYRLRDSNGAYRWMKNYETVYKVDDTGKPIQLLGVAFDVSQEKYYAEEIEAKEEALLEAQNLANIGSFTWDIASNKITHASRPLQVLGLTEGDSFEGIMSNVHPSDKVQILAAYQKAIAGKREYECEYRCGITDRERILWSRGKVIFLNGSPVQFKATIMDVTDKHHMIRKLQRSEELYKQAQALNKIGNWSWNFNSDRVQWSDELFRIYGLPPQSEQMTFERYCSFVHPGDRQSRKEVVDDQMKDPGHREYYFRILTADGQQKILYGQSEVLINEEGVPYKMIGTCQDVTIQKTLEKNLYDRTIQLQKSNASLKVFAYISSHDLKEPLRKISLFGDRLRMLNASKLDEQSSGILKTIIQSSLRLQQMIDEILSVSRINSEDSFEDASLQDILEEVLLSIEGQIEEKSAIITYDPLPVAFVNPVQIRQLFVNLISNSLKFTRPAVPPTINITCDFPSVREITDMGLENSRRFLRMRFTDNGIGFHNDYAEKIFAIFQRLNDKSAYKGTGIGLAVCREIVGHHGGIITANGTLHQGAIFSVVLPVQSS